MLISVFDSPQPTRLLSPGPVTMVIHGGDLALFFPGSIGAGLMKISFLPG